MVISNVPLIQIVIRQDEVLAQIVRILEPIGVRALPLVNRSLRAGEDIYLLGVSRRSHCKGDENHEPCPARSHDRAPHD